MRGKGFTIQATCLAVAGLLSLSACGESSSGSTAKVDVAGLAVAKAAAAKGRAAPPFKAPSDPVDLSALKGKSIFFVPIQDTPGDVQVGKTMKQVADENGIKFTYYSNQGEVADWVKGVQAAIAQKADLIWLDAIDPSQLQPQIKEAKAAGIPVVVANVFDGDASNPPGCAGCADVTALIKAPYSEAARQSANWTIADSKGKANVLIVTLDGLPAADTMTTAGVAEYKKNCPSCVVKVVRLQLSQVGKAGGFDAVTTALAKDPNIDYVNPQFDPLISGTTAAVRTANRVDKVKMMSFNGTPDALKQIKSGDTPLVMDVAEPYSGDQVGYQYLDQAFRILAGMKPDDDSLFPLRLVDTDNIKETGSDFSQTFGTAYKAAYRQLWGIQ